MRQTVVMLTTSYPRFPGDSIGTFMEPIAQGVAGRGHHVHVVVPWHPLWRRAGSEGRVRFHVFRYAPLPILNVFGYAAALHADVSLRLSAVAVAPLALAAGWWRARQVAREARATIMHAHWVIPGGVIGAAAAGPLPLIISLHGSDVYVAERHRVARRAARAALARAAWVTACSADLGARGVALGAPAGRTTVVPYGVDSERFKPDRAARRRGRTTLGVGDDTPVVFAFGRLVNKKGFEYLIEAGALLARDWPRLHIVIAGEGDLDQALRAQAARCGLAERVQFLGVVPQDRIPVFLAAADVAVVPSIHDEAGNVDGLPNTVMEILASGTPLVATRVGGIGAVAADGETARLVPERNAQALAQAIDGLLRDATRRAAMGHQAREVVCREHSWARVAEQFEEIYARVAVRWT
jgi:glycosyltransferase involved in cell wall biosynthesis